MSKPSLNEKRLDLYVVQFKSGYIKVGRTTCFKRRLRQLENGHGAKATRCDLFVGMGHIEGSIHARLKHYRKEGEFFHGVTYKRVMQVVNSLIN